MEKRIIDGIDVSGVWSNFLEPHWVEPDLYVLNEIRQFAGGEEIDKCFQCGTCTSSCRVSQVCDRFNPRNLINLLRGGYQENLAQAYLCTLCAKCNKLCPRELDRRKLGLAIRQYLVSKQQQPTNIDLMKDGIEKEHNVANFPNRDRGLWAELMDDVPDDLYQKESADTLYFVGCMASFSPAIQELPGIFAKLLEMAEVNFSILAEREYCCGYPLIVAGMKEKIKELIEYNTARIKEIGAKEVVFTCPSCYHTFLHEYKIDGVKFFHHTEYLKLLIDEGRIELDGLPIKVTYHDPCDLGRNSGVYDPPREILKNIPKLEFFEMRDNREYALCCGGGGDVEIVDATLPTKIGEKVIERAKETGASVLATACGQCKRTLAGIKDKDIKVKDILELVMEATEDGKD